MIGAYLRRGVVAGLLAGLLAGAVGLLAGEPGVDAAVAREAALAAGIGRGVQKVGLVVGTILVGVAVGTLFAVAAAWAVGRVEGDGWARSLKLGAALAGAVVLLPALKYPPNPPAVGDPASVGGRTTAYVGVVLIGLLLAALAWAVGRQLRAGRPALAAPLRQVLVGAGVLLLAGGLLAGLPAAGATPAGFPADLLWRFRIGAVATQLSLVAGVAVAFGLLTVRAEQDGAGARAPAAAT
jgi:Probable cobalt transporter subunit (CbtA)